LNCLKKEIDECFVCFEKNLVVKASWKAKEENFFEETGKILKISCKKDLN